MKNTATIKPRRTQDDIKQLLGRYQQSGQTVQAFCDAEGVASSSVYKWLRRERPAKKVPELVEVTSVPRAGVGFAVGTPQGYRVEVPGGFSTDELKRLLDVLRA